MELSRKSCHEVIQCIGISTPARLKQPGLIEGGFVIGKGVCATFEPRRYKIGRPDRTARYINGILRYVGKALKTLVFPDVFRLP
jgi:hypothetical protein